MIRRIFNHLGAATGGGGIAKGVQQELHSSPLLTCDFVPPRRALARPRFPVLLMRRTAAAKIDTVAVKFLHSFSVTFYFLATVCFPLGGPCGAAMGVARLILAVACPSAPSRHCQPAGLLELFGIPAQNGKTGPWRKAGGGVTRQTMDQISQVRRCARGGELARGRGQGAAARAAFPARHLCGSV